MSRTLPIIEFDYVDSNGLHLLVIFSTLGFRCGYVGVPSDHFAYSSPKDDFIVHGGITFRSYSCHGMSYFFQTHCYWGFDCGHYNDAHDIEAAKQYGLPVITSPSGTVRTLDYVKSEIFSLAHQLNSIQLFI